MSIETDNLFNIQTTTKIRMVFFLPIEVAKMFPMSDIKSVKIPSESTENRIKYLSIVLIDKFTCFILFHIHK